jgi:hypothetical protein
MGIHFGATLSDRAIAKLRNFLTHYYIWLSFLYFLNCYIETHTEESQVSWLDKTFGKEQINGVGRQDFCLPKTVDFHGF